MTPLLLIPLLLVSTVGDTGPVGYSTTLSVSPPSPVPAGTTEVLTATFHTNAQPAGPASHDPGVVTFTDGNATIGTVTVDATASESALTLVLPVGQHSLAASLATNPAQVPAGNYAGAAGHVFVPANTVTYTVTPSWWQRILRILHLFGW